MVIPNQNILITQENLRNIQDPFNLMLEEITSTA